MYIEYISDWGKPAKLGKNPLRYAGLGFFSQGYLALGGAFGNCSGK